MTKRPRRPKGLSEEAKAKKKLKHIAHLAKMEGKREYHYLRHYPSEFLVFRNSNEHVQTKIAQKFPPNDDLPVLPSSDDSYLSYLYLLWHPGTSTLLARMTAEVNQWLKNVGAGTSAPGALHTLAGRRASIPDRRCLGPVYRCQTLSTQEQARKQNTFPGYHFGIWQHYALLPYITLDSLQGDLKGDRYLLVIQRMDEFLSLVKKYIVPAVERMLQWYAPQQIQILEPVYEKVLETLGPQLHERPALNFGGLFFTIAAKEGSSERIHLDFFDAHGLVTFIFIVSRRGSTWSGGDFIAPQLGGRIPFRGGQAIAVRTRSIAHAGAEVTGLGRIAITCFCNSVADKEEWASQRLLWL
ncbi:hypothetical protein R3P38DRAFT_2793880 [Favolaschia claudopus]|uniref:Prolyl 4-hydroxylase alpha subunit domain-containing protein n=1 Tax=Favolaschia claudopus TaxID=2862362 RepID=A0AAW0ABQ6_9AGAR